MGLISDIWNSGATGTNDEREAQAAAQRAAEEEAARQAAEQAAFNQALQDAYNQAVSHGRDYFSSKGASIDPYQAQLTQRLDDARATVPNLHENPSQFFVNVPETLYGDLRQDFRNNQVAAFDAFAAPGFADALITPEADDAALYDVASRQSSEANEYIGRLLDRGVVTERGVQGAQNEVDRQREIAVENLQDIGGSILELGRQDLRDIAGQGRAAASLAELDQFDPNIYHDQINQSRDAFFAGLADQIEGVAPQQLFNLNDLANIAGNFQGAGNTRFDPEAVEDFAGTASGFDDLNVDDGEEQNTRRRFKRF